jgi:hypothetical protein
MKSIARRIDRIARRMPAPPPKPEPEWVSLMQFFQEKAEFESLRSYAQAAGDRFDPADPAVAEIFARARARRDNSK